MLATGMHITQAASREIMHDEKERKMDICVFCGSSSGKDPAYAHIAHELGQAIAANGDHLVYGGGRLGLMGALVEAALAAGGTATGVIPAFLAERLGLPVAGGQVSAVEDVIVTRDMHARKLTMFESADAFIALPGGIGTLEELVEQLTWAQLERHAKPVILVNTNGYWAPLLHLFEHMREQQFLRPGLDFHIEVTANAEDAVARCHALIAAQPRA
ncbi:MAG: TIGR00730 family Rossman fold protein [Pseudomonadota bacterium]